MAAGRQVSRVRCRRPVASAGGRGGASGVSAARRLRVPSTQEAQQRPQSPDVGTSDMTRFLSPLLQQFERFAGPGLLGLVDQLLLVFDQ